MTVVLEFLLKMFSERAMVEIIKLPSRKKITKIALADNLDIGADKIIHEVIRGNVKNLKDVFPIEGKTIKPLFLFLDEEVLLYAKLKKLKFKEEKKEEDKITNFVNNLEKKHPEIKRAIVNGWLELEN